MLTSEYGAIELDVTQLLIDAMRQQAAAAGLPWETVRAADAAPPGSRDAAGLAVLVQRSLPAVDAAIDQASAAAPQASRPVLLTEIAPLARYGHLGLLAPRADLATRRPQAIWVAVPQLPGNQGAVIDGRPLPARRPRSVLPPRIRLARPPGPRPGRRSRMTATAALTTDLQRQVLILEDDVRARLAADPVREGEWKQEHQQATDKDRTAANWVTWRDDRVTQAAVAWVLTTVFIRFCEDNDLLRPVWITGPGARRQEALDAQLAFFREHPDDTDREWLLGRGQTT